MKEVLFLKSIVSIILQYIYELGLIGSQMCLQEGSSLFINKMYDVGSSKFSNIIRSLGGRKYR